MDNSPLQTDSMFEHMVLMIIGDPACRVAAVEAVVFLGRATVKVVPQAQGGQYEDFHPTYTMEIPKENPLQFAGKKRWEGGREDGIQITEHEDSKLGYLSLDLMASLCERDGEARKSSWTATEAAAEIKTPLLASVALAYDPASGLLRLDSGQEAARRKVSGVNVRAIQGDFIVNDMGNWAEMAFCLNPRPLRGHGTLGGIGRRMPANEGDRILVSCLLEAMSQGSLGIQYVKVVLSQLPGMKGENAAVDVDLEGETASADVDV
jgi:hypothetical protein